MYRILTDLAQCAPLPLGKEGAFASPEVVCVVERGKAAVQNDGEILDLYGLSMIDDDELAFYLLNTFK